MYEKSLECQTSKEVSCPGPNVIKLFTSVIYESSQKARIFRDKPFQPSLMFVGKAKSTPLKGAFLMCSTWVGSNLSHK